MVFIFLAYFMQADSLPTEPPAKLQHQWRGVFKSKGELVDNYWRKLTAKLVQVFANWHLLNLGS